MSLPTLMPMTFPPARRVESLLPSRDVCPHCKRPVTAHAFRTGDFTNHTSHCRVHGDVIPMRSAVWRNDYETD